MYLTDSTFKTYLYEAIKRYTQETISDAASSTLPQAEYEARALELMGMETEAFRILKNTSFKIE